ncbi:hypothetical protein WH87_04565 [Devosia epidermidihirudinis]|uniref:Uncharacterized protein n=1 Tax=Devosia epidermidihirudinis TaxID=1293439 RepID=A0A0F5QFI3_9HYPH|nr:hypothetical protein [Devosia epidermidihirudinis]KKC39478.1 hypothetical protein WH87_04565 [Devosia epidermidihirudinis]
MNTANLQLEGLLIAMASMTNLLVAKGLVSTEEIAGSLDRSEQTVLGDYRVEEMDPAQRDVIAFPIRLLKLANNGGSPGEVQTFSELAKLVGQTKDSYNDQA